MSRNRVIGIHGGLPWQHLPKDRKIFQALTTNKILILGRKTFFEQHPTTTTTTTTSLDHIRHARCCIVVSSSMTRIGLETAQPYAPTTELKLARSLSEALELAQAMTSTFKKEEEKEEEEVTGILGISSPIDCWVVGGQGLYEEALLVSSSSTQQQQPGASAVVEVHLSVVDLDIPETTVQDNDDDDCRRIARFPDPLRWKDQFEQVSKVEFPPETEMMNGSEKNVIVPGFTYYYYKRMLD
jgi:dihydrofolate reductase